MFGGGMRQVGVLAAAARIALEESPKHLEIDHRHARRLAEGIAEIPGLRIDPRKVQTNIVIFDCQGSGLGAVELCDALKPQGVWALDTAPYAVRFVTHSDVDSEGVDRALGVLREVVTRAHRKSA
jgi:threonine aldolase